MEEERLSWNAWFKHRRDTAKRSPCKRLHVGCLLVKSIISQGYNGYLPGCPHEQKMRDGHDGYRSCGNERDNRLCKARCKFYEHCIYTLSM